MARLRGKEALIHAGIRVIDAFIQPYRYAVQHRVLPLSRQMSFSCFAFSAIVPLAEVVPIAPESEYP